MRKYYLKLMSNYWVQLTIRFLLLPLLFIAICGGALILLLLQFIKSAADFTSDAAVTDSMKNYTKLLKEEEKEDVGQK